MLTTIHLGLHIAILDVYTGSALFLQPPAADDVLLWTEPVALMDADAHHVAERLGVDVSEVLTQASPSLHNVDEQAALRHLNAMGAYLDSPDPDDPATRYDDYLVVGQTPAGRTIVGMHLEESIHEPDLGDLAASDQALMAEAMKY